MGGDTITVVSETGITAIVQTATPVAIVIDGTLRGPQGPAGANGAVGPAGPTGATGAAGSTWYEGAGAPSTTHNNGDLYLNLTNGDVYKQTSGSWGSPVGNIEGPTGPTGPSGPTYSAGTGLTLTSTTFSLTTPVAVANGGTGVTTSTGTGSVVLSTSPTLVTPVIGVATGTSLALSGTTGALALGTTINSGISLVIDPGANANKGIVVFNHSGSQTGNLLELQNASFVAMFAVGPAGHVLVEGVTSTGATGTGNLVFGTSPSLTTPNLGTPSAINLTNAAATSLPISAINATGTPSATTYLRGDGSWQTVSGGGAVTGVSNSDGTLTISPTTGAVVASLALGHANTWTGAQTFNAGKLLDKGEIVFDVKAFGAVGNNSTDDTSAIQAAIDAANTAGGGKVWFPVGTYKISSPLKLYSGSSPTIVAYQNITIDGAGSSNTGGAIINQITTGDDVILGINDAANGAQVMNITIKNVCLQFNGGVLTNSGNGIYLKAQAANSPAFYHFHFENVKVANCQGSGKYGFNFESIIVSDLIDCEAVVCANGFLFNGAANSTQWSSVNTSITMSSCYSNSSIGYGYRIIDTTYMSMNGCACDVSNNNVSTSAYSIEAGNAISLAGCGFEGDGTHTLANGFHIAADSFSTGSEQITLTSCYGFQSKSTIEVYVTGVSTGINIFGYQSNSSISGSTGLKVDAGSSVFEAGCAWDTGVATVRTLANGSFDTIMGDSDGWGTFYLPGATSGQTKIIATAAASGVLTLPAATDTLVARATTDTLTNKTISGSSNTLSNIALASLAAAAYATAATASTLAERDSSANLTVNALIQSTASTATAGGTTTLTIASAPVQVFITGSPTTQTVKLPTTSVAAGAQYIIINQSTGAVTVQSSGANTIATLAGSSVGIFVAQKATPTAATDWIADVTVDGKALTINNSLAFAGTDGTTMTFPSSSDTVVTLAATQTQTNKRITKRSGTTAGPGATPTLNTDNYDIYTFTALAAAITSMTTNLSGTPNTGDKLLLGFKDNGTARAITWGASFKSSGVATLLATTVINKQHWVELMYDGSAWVCLAVDATGY